MESNRTKLFAAVAMFAVAGVLLYRAVFGPAEHGEDLPEGTFWMCKNPACGAEFNMSLSEVIELRGPNGAVPCPKCKDRRTVRGFRCPSCKRHYLPEGHARRPDVCPHCGKPIPPPEDLVKARQG